MAVTLYANQRVIEGPDAADKIAAIIRATESLDIGIKIENVWFPDPAEEDTYTLHWVVTMIGECGEPPHYEDWDGAYEEDAEAETEAG